MKGCAPRLDLKQRQEQLGNGYCYGDLSGSQRGVGREVVTCYELTLYLREVKSSRSCFSAASALTRHLTVACFVSMCFCSTASSRRSVS